MITYHFSNPTFVHLLLTFKPQTLDKSQRRVGRPSSGLVRLGGGGGGRVGRGGWRPLHRVEDPADLRALGGRHMLSDVHQRVHRQTREGLDYAGEEI